MRQAGLPEGNCRATVLDTGSRLLGSNEGSSRATPHHDVAKRSPVGEAEDVERTPERPPIGRLRAPSKDAMRAPKMPQKKRGAAPVAANGLDA